MKYSNFRNYRVHTERDGFIDKVTKFATVTEKTGYWWNRKSRDIEVFKEPFGASWKLMETGGFTDGYEVEGLEAAYLARIRREAMDRKATK